MRKTLSCSQGYDLKLEGYGVVSGYGLGVIQFCEAAGIRSLWASEGALDLLMN